MTDDRVEQLSAQVESLTAALGAMMAQQGVRGFRPEPALGPCLNDYADDLRARRTRVYAEEVARTLPRILEEMGVRRFSDCTPSALHAYADRRLRVGDVSPRTVEKECRSVRAFIRWCIAEGRLEDDPSDGWRPRFSTGLHAQTRPRRPLTEAEVDRLLEAVDAADRRRVELGDLPQRPLWGTLAETGARFGETVALRWLDFDHDGRTLRFRAETTKTRAERTVPISEELAGLLERQREPQTRILGRAVELEDPLILTPRGRPMTHLVAMKQWRSLLAAADLERVDRRGYHVSPHSLRMTVATRLHARGVPPAAAAAILGHLDPRTTLAHYVRLEAEDLRQYVDGAA